MDIQSKLEAMYALDDFENDGDPERMLYDGFIGDKDKRVMGELRKAKVEVLSSQNFVFDDKRLNDMLFRYKARNFQASLSSDEKREWREFVKERLLVGGRNRLSIMELKNRIDELQIENASFPEKIKVLNQLKEYAVDLESKYL